MFLLLDGTAYYGTFILTLRLLSSCRWCLRLWLLDVAPLIDTIKVFEILVKGSTTIDFVIGDVLHENFLDVWFRKVSPFLNDGVP